MSEIPNFADRVQEVEQKMESEWQSVQGVWRDSIAENFQQTHMEPYLHTFQKYIKSVEQLPQQMEKHREAMASIAGY